MNSLTVIITALWIWLIIGLIITLVRFGRWARRNAKAVGIFLLLSSASDIALLVMVLLSTPAYGYDYTADLHRDCVQWGLNNKSMFGEPLCEAVEVQALTKAEALRKGLQYRAVSWGKLFPADEDGYYLPVSGEFIPRSWSVQSPDDKFHRCTYPLNNYWDGGKWTVVPDNSTGDGKPPTRCFWNPHP